jgi:hypothetical protein
MSFFTSLQFYRPRPPPRVTGPELAAFVERLYALDLVEEGGVLSFSLKSGLSIDQDDQEANWEEPVEPGSCVYNMRSIEWDSQEYRSTRSELLAALHNFAGAIYRAQLSLGSLTPSFSQSISRIDSPENSHDFQPDSMNLTIGPIVLSNLTAEEQLHTGWIGVSLSGYGYLFPWTLREAVERLEGNHDVGRLMQTCRNQWPVAAEKPSEEICQVRQEYQTHWPYPEITKSWDWYWGVIETG